MDTKGRFTFNPYQEDINSASSIFEKAWKDKTPLREISKVEISKEVLEWFLSLETDYTITDERQAELKKRRPNVSIKNNHPINWKRTKYLFTLYIWTKIQENYLNKPNIHYIQECAKRFREDADLKPSFILNNERNLLYDLGFININYALGIEVTFIDKFDVFKIPITDDNRIVIELYKDNPNRSYREIERLCKERGIKVKDKTISTIINKCVKMNPTSILSENNNCIYRSTVKNYAVSNNNIEESQLKYLF